MPFNPFKKGDWDKLGKQTKDEFSKVERAIRDVGEDVRASLQKTGADCRNGVRAMGREVEDSLQKSVKKVEGLEGDFQGLMEAIRQDIDAMPGMMKGLAQEAVADIIRAAGKKSLTTALDIVDTVAPDSISLTFGPVVIEVGDVFDKIETIRALAKSPPGRAQEITDAVISLAPASVHINLAVGLGFVIQSDSAQVGIDLGWSGDSVFEHLPALLEKCGVPK